MIKNINLGVFKALMKAAAVALAVLLSSAGVAITDRYMVTFKPTYDNSSKSANLAGL